MGKIKEEVRFSRLNWDVEFIVDMMNGNGFIISEPAEISLDGTRKKSLYGPQSPLYGTSYEDENAFMERYRCRCGAFTGRIFEGEKCPICNTVVEFKDANMSMTGWITLGKHKIINPYYYQVLHQAIGKAFPDIVNAKHRIDKDGNRKELTPEDFETKPSSPFVGIGIEKFYEQFENILDYFKSIKKNKASTIDILKSEKDKVFCSHIPIYSTKLRPQSVTADTYYFGTMDKQINTAFSLSEALKKSMEIERDLILSRLQTRVNAMWTLVFDMINGKEGFIREQLLGGSLNFTSRNVIIPDPTLKINEVDMGYQTFRIVFRNKICYYIMKVKDCHLSQALTIWENSIKFNPFVYSIMQSIIENETIRLLINRNPTLNYYSMLLMKIRRVKPDDNDYTLSINLSVLPGLNADFDGDIINIIALPEKPLVKMYRKFDPVHRMIIDRDNGNINELFVITKSQLIDLYNFCTLNPSDCDTEEIFDE